VYSLTGQLVRTLASGARPPGLSSLVWDGRDRGGNQVQPGIYMVRIVAPGLSATRRAVLLR
jgi:flagellar hook assembly protein FlgD